jgi:glycosyltransferase involved in cell wall biosynthesis
MLRKRVLRQEAEFSETMKLAVLNTHPIQYFAPLYRRLSREPDIDLTVYFCSRQGADEYLDAGFGQRFKWDLSLLDGYEHKFVPNLRRRDAVEGFWSLINPQIIRELRTNKFDALLVNGHNHATYILAILAARILGIRVLMRCDTHLLLRRPLVKRLIRRAVMTAFYNHLCTFCLPVGTANKEFYLFHNVKETRLFTAPFAVDNEYFVSAVERAQKDETGKALALPSDKPVILFASKLIARKRPVDLLLAFHGVKQRGIEGALVFVGSGEQEQILRDYTRHHDLPDVYFLGFRNQSELPEFFAMADIFVLPAENEPWGLILNEVMCAGLPVIVSREVGASADLVRHGENGFLFDSGNVEQLADYLRRLLINPELRKRMGEASRKIIANWDYEACVQGIRQALAVPQSSSKQLAANQAA